MHSGESILIQKSRRWRVSALPPLRTRSSQQSAWEVIRHINWSVSQR